MGVNVLVVGATGGLGRKIVDALVRRGASEVRALVRPGKPGAADDLRGRGARPVEVDVADVASLGPACAGVDVVVSAVSNEPALIIDGQKALADAAEGAGARRFIPSDFSADFFKVSDGDNLNMDMRRRLHERLASNRIPITTIHNGMFLEGLFGDWSFQFDPAAGTFSYWGEPRACDFTATDDVAEYAAAAALDPDAPRELKVAGDVLTMPQAAEAFGRATGRAVEPVCRGSLDELRALIEEKKRTATNVWAYLALQYHYTMVSGKAKLDRLDNERYPEVRPMTVEAYLRAHPESIKKA